MKKTILFLCLCACMLVLTACAERYETKTVEAIVIDKEYDPAKNKKVKRNGKTKTVREEAEYEVNVLYDNIEAEFESPNDKFYKSVKVGDKIKVNLIQGFDKEGKVVSERLEQQN